jgi:hypothetical protein
MLFLLWAGIACIVVAGAIFFFKKFGAPLGAKPKPQNGETSQEPQEPDDFTLESLEVLHDTGSLNDEEFARARAKIIARAAKLAADKASTTGPTTGIVTAGGLRKPLTQMNTRPNPPFKPVTDSGPNLGTPGPAPEPTEPKEPKKPAPDESKGTNDGGPGGSSPNSRNGELW